MNQFYLPLVELVYKDDHNPSTGKQTVTYPIQTIVRMSASNLKIGRITHNLQALLIRNLRWRKHKFQFYYSRHLYINSCVLTHMTTENELRQDCEYILFSVITDILYTTVISFTKLHLILLVHVYVSHSKFLTS